MAKVAVNFGLVFEPPEWDYETTIDDLNDEITEELNASNENWANVLQAFTPEELLFLRWQMCWKAMAREKQLPPPEFQSGDKTIWGIRSGRGFGKTLCAANWLGGEACRIPGSYAVIAPTHDDVRYTCFEGPTGLLSCIPPQLIVSQNSSLPMLTVKTLGGGVSVIRGFAGDVPERLRGPQHHKIWCDEIASWKYPQDAWDMLMFGLRLGHLPQVLWTGTPKPTPFIRKLVDDPRGVCVVGSTYENAENLTDVFYENVAKYEGTKIGRQELYGEVLDPEEEGFVKRSQWRLWPSSRPLPKFDYIVYSLDTAFKERNFDKKKLESDPTACSVWGVFNIRRFGQVEKHVMLLDAWEDYLGLPALIKRVKQEQKLTYGAADDRRFDSPLVGKRKGKGKAIDLILIEEKGSGISLMQSLAAENILSQGYNPGNEDKLTRLHVVSPLFANGRVWAVESDVNPSEFRTWAQPLVSQVCSYIGPGSTEHDDLLDTTTQALRLVSEKFFGPFTIKRDPQEEKRQAALDEQRKRKARRNPYG
ncbi:terminase large subunit domain-containing protein [[Eubacterium] cellulosolvens]